MKKTFDFEEIRPMYDEEVAEGIQNLLSEERFLRAVRFAMPQMEESALVETLQGIQSKREFQIKMAVPFLEGLAQKTALGMEMGGAEQLSTRSSYTYITNHRDIVLDASFLNVLLYRNGFNTCEVAIGDNLLIYPWIERLVRINKSFIVKRGVSVRKMMEVSTRLSAYIRFAVQIKHESVWIAQREGRAKDANDYTQESLLKMLNLAAHADVITNMEALNIAPISLSYEYDPCDYLKAREFQLKRDNPDWKKSPEEDLQNMQEGMFGYKGHIHFQMTPCINSELQQIDCTTDKATQFAAVAAIIDKAIHANYHIYAGNYVAHDLLSGEERFSAHYTAAEKATFEAYLAKQLAKIADVPNRDEQYLRMKILEMYANPLKNQLIALG